MSSCMSWTNKIMLYISSCVWVDHIVMFLTEADVSRDIMLNESMFAYLCVMFDEAQTGVQMKALFESFLLAWQNKRHWGFLCSQYKHHFSHCT